MCPACGSEYCVRAECVKEEYKANTLELLQRLREKNDGRRVSWSLQDFDNLVAEVSMNWRPIPR